MKKTRIFAIIIAAACLLVCMPVVSAAIYHEDTIVPSTGDHAITVDQAKDSIQVFQNDPVLEPTYLGEENSPYGTYYTFATESSFFLVNPDTGAVEMAWFGDNMPTSPTVMNIDEDEAYAKAVEYAGQKSDDFSKKEWATVSYKLDYPEDGAWGYVFSFNEKIGSGNDTIFLPSMVQVSVNPETGAIYQYQSMNR